MYTRELGARICSYVEALGFEATAAERAGVHRNTVRNWRMRGERGDPEFAEFARDLITAKARWTERHLSSIDDPKWLLERSDREQFAPPSRYEVTGAGGGAIATTHAVLSVDAANEIRRKVLYGESEDE